MNLSRYNPDFHTVEKGAINWFAISHWNLPGNLRLKFVTSRGNADRVLSTLIQVVRLEDGIETFTGAGPGADLYIPVGRQQVIRMTEGLVRTAHATAIADYFDTVIPRIEQQYASQLAAKHEKCDNG